MQGQALWQPPVGRTALVGDLLLATNANGDFFVQLSKNPFPLVTAQYSDNLWSIQFGNNKHRWHGEGEPPRQFMWFVLPGALNNATPGQKWKFTRKDAGSFLLQNPRTGESLEGTFYP